MYVKECLCLIVVLYFVAKFITRVGHIKRCLKTLPGPTPIFLLGNALDFAGDKGMIEVLRAYTEKYGSLMKTKFGPFFHAVVVSDVEFIKQVLLRNTNLSKGPIYDLTKCWLGKGLLTSEEDKWRGQRKILTPAFTNKILMDFIVIFDQHAKVLVEKFEGIVPVHSINIHEPLSLCSLDIICETVMGVCINAQKNEDLEYVRCVKDMCKIISNRSTQLWKFFEPFFWFSSDYRKQKRCLKIIKNHINHVIKMRREQRISMKEQCYMKDFGSERKTLLDVLLDYSENEKHLNEQEIEDEVHTFMFAGHDTVTAAMDFLIYELSRNPQIQDLTFQEQKQIFGDDMNKEMSFSEVHDMTYLDMVIKETLRKYPPVGLITRRVDEEFKYKDYTIPEGSILSLFIHGLHRNSEIFPNPDVFDPNRFVNPDMVLPFSFIPFSTGPRNCIGQKFAMYEMKVILSKLVRKFKFLSTVPEHTLDLRGEVVLTSRNGVKVGIVPRR